MAAGQFHYFVVNYRKFAKFPSRGSVPAGISRPFCSNFLNKLRRSTSSALLPATRYNLFHKFCVFSIRPFQCIVSIDILQTFSIALLLNGLKY